MNIVEVINKIKNMKNCNIHAPIQYQINLKLPIDLIKFYTICNGVELFLGEDFSYRILGIDELEKANKIILNENYEDDISNNWYVIATDYNGDYIAIDLSSHKLGWCYDAYHETYALIGDMPIIAKSFTELLVNLYQSNGKVSYWNINNFVSYGDAYD